MTDNTQPQTWSIRDVVLLTAPDGRQWDLRDVIGVSAMSSGAVPSLLKRLNADHAAATKLAALGEELLAQKAIADKATELLSERVGFTPALVRQRLRNNYESETKLANRDAEADALAQALEGFDTHMLVSSVYMAFQDLHRYECRKRESRGERLWDVEFRDCGWFACKMAREEVDYLSKLHITTRAALTAYRERKAREGVIPLDERRHV